MKRYSIVPSSARKKTALETGSVLDDEDSLAASMEFQQLDQAVTSTLQDIDKNIAKSSAIINDKIFPIIRKYTQATDNVWKNVNYWKYFFERAADAEITTYQSPTTGPVNDLLADEEQGSNDLNTANKRNEDSATWSAEHHNKRLKTATHQNYLDRTNLEPPTLNTRIGGSPTRNPDVAVYTVRKSMDQYHKLSISPRKENRTKTPIRNNDEFHRRSSIIRSFKDSSPSLPDPPVLMSEIGNSSINEKSDSNSLNDSELPPFDSVPRPKRHSLLEIGPELQRFPRTPQFERAGVTGGRRTSSLQGSRRTSIARTPLRSMYGDDSELNPPPKLTTDHGGSTAVNDSDVGSIAFPDLETINLHQREDERRKLEGRSRDHTSNEVVDKDSPFIEATEPAIAAATSAGSTLYHSVDLNYNKNK